MEAPRVVGRRIQRQSKPAADLIARHDRGQHGRPVRAHELARRQGGRDHGRGGMQGAFGVGVVEIQ